MFQPRPGIKSLYSILVLAVLTAFGVSLRSQTAPFSDSVLFEIEELTLARYKGAQFWGMWLSPSLFFTKDTAISDINQEAVNERKIVIQEASLAGLQPVGIIPTWSFPPFAEAKAADGPSIGGVSAMPPAVPTLGSSEYQRLSKIRADMIEGLARLFPEIRIWVIGAESAYHYYSPPGAELDQGDLIAFFVDTLRDAKQAVRKGNPQAVLVANFIAGEYPMKIKGRNVQPREILELIATEIGRRGARAADYFDFNVGLFDPALLEDREPRKPVFLRLPAPASGAASSSSALNHPRTAGWQSVTPGTDVAPPATGGWVWSPPFYLDDFDTSCPDLLTSSDWERLHTDTTICPLIDPLPVAGGRIEMLHTGPAGECGGITGAAVSRFPRIPTLYQGSGEKNLWTVVHDFHVYASEKPNSEDFYHHPAVMLRVNFRDAAWGVPDQTRFGTIVYPSPEAGGPAIGGMQFTGDKYNCPSCPNRMHIVVPFSLSSHPWPNEGSRFYRIQILEREKYVREGIYYRWQKQWAAETWDISTEWEEDYQGGHDWISDTTIKNSYHIDIPPLLPDSRIIFADATGFSGGIHTERVGTTSWQY